MKGVASEYERNESLIYNRTSTDMQQGISAEERMSQQLQALLLSGRTAPMAMIANEQKVGYMNDLQICMCLYFHMYVPSVSHPFF